MPFSELKTERLKLIFSFVSKVMTELDGITIGCNLAKH